MNLNSPDEHSCALRLEDIRGRLIALLQILEGSEAKGLGPSLPKSVLSRLFQADSNVPAKWYEDTTDPEHAAAFQRICADISSLPDEYKTLIINGLKTSHAGEPFFQLWAAGQNCPLRFALPEHLKALNLGITIILNEREEDKDFRHFFTTANSLFDIMCARYGEEKFIPEKIKDIEDSGRKLRDKLKEQYDNLAPRYQRMLDMNLGRYSLSNMIKDLASNDFFVMTNAASKIYNASSQIYFDENHIIMTIEIDEETDDIEDISFPEDDSPEYQS
jgi:hypothetical protein